MNFEFMQSKNEVSTMMNLLTSQAFYEFLKSKENNTNYEDAYYAALEAIASESYIPDWNDADQFIPANDPIYTNPLQF